MPSQPRRVLTEIGEGVAIVGGYPALYLRDSDAVCIADLHLGYEEALAENSGITVPSRQLEDVKRLLLAIVASASGCCAGSEPESELEPYETGGKKISKLIINGDLKHVFSKASFQEWREVPKFVEFASRLFEKIILVRGNHDTKLSPLRRYAVEIVSAHVEGDTLFSHGHSELDAEGFKNVVIAHEHPVLVLGDRIGARVKLPCFLRGVLGDANLIVMPAFSPLAGGTPVNLVSNEELLSPVIREVGLEEMEVFAVDEEAGVLSFPRLGEWRAVSLRL
ncbi:MAG: Metallophosphoesterase superfamily enzyme [Candidatus Alkanophagales archaeon MCA70_species_1]|nr:Metallophosphoesterase superfamily enzyme [Candidatus Alkanophaga volatiphilum]